MRTACDSAAREGPASRKDSANDKEPQERACAEVRHVAWRELSRYGGAARRRAKESRNARWQGRRPENPRTGFTRIATLSCQGRGTVDTDDRRLLLDVIEHLKKQDQAIAEIRRLVGPSGILFPDGTLLVQTIHGTKYFIDPSDLVMAPQLVVYRQWESDVSAFILSAVKENSIFMDV